MIRKIPDMAALLAETPRSQAYLQALARRGLAPNFALILKNPDPAVKKWGQLPNGFSAGPETDGGAVPLVNLHHTVQDSLQQAEVPYRELPTVDVNSKTVLDAVAARPETHFIYSGLGGTLVERPLLSMGKSFLHSHSGRLPDFRGSTTVYYSLLELGRCWVSVILLSAEIDQGPVLAMAPYDPPDDPGIIDYIYDPSIRADLLAQVLVDFTESGCLPPLSREQESHERTPRTFYIIHPVLKHLAIMSAGHRVEKTT